MPSSLSLRGGRRPTWQSRSTRPDHRKAIGENATAFPRLPRRFAPRNDTSGGYCGAPAPSSGLIPLCKALNERRYRRNRSVRFYRHLVRTGSAFPRLPRRFAPRNDTSGQHSDGNGAAHRIGGTTAASRTGGACPAPTGPVRIERRPAYDPFFILQYSLFIISSIPLRGMANHMTKRPEIPCLSCKFPQSRRICH